MTTVSAPINAIELLRPHELTGDEAPVVYRAKHIRALFAEIDRLRISNDALLREDRCPFDNPKFDIGNDDPCPLCGMLGTDGAEVKCITPYSMARRVR